MQFLKKVDFCLAQKKEFKREQTEKGLKESTKERASIYIFLDIEQKPKACVRNEKLSDTLPRISKNHFMEKRGRECKNREAEKISSGKHAKITKFINKDVRETRRSILGSDGMMKSDCSLSIL